MRIRLTLNDWRLHGSDRMPQDKIEGIILSIEVTSPMADVLRVPVNRRGRAWAGLTGPKRARIAASLGRRRREKRTIRCAHLAGA